MLNDFSRMSELAFKMLGTPFKMPDKRSAVAGGALCGDSMNRLFTLAPFLDKEIGVPAQRTAQKETFNGQGWQPASCPSDVLSN
jgi:hypothetical protein